MTFYKVKHLGCPDESCDGNVRIITSDRLPELQATFIDWNVAEDGTITSLGDSRWIAEGKTFIATPVHEDSDALTIGDRLFLNMRPFSAFFFRAKIEPNWDLIPDIVKNHPDKDAWLAKAQEGSYSHEDLANFVCCPEVTNVKVDFENLTISGYDHSTESQYSFSPVVN